jgi:hypothetical protein
VALTGGFDESARGGEDARDPIRLLRSGHWRKTAPGLGRVKTRSSFCVGTILSILKQKNQKHRTYMPGNRTFLAAIFGRWTFSHGLGHDLPFAFAELLATKLSLATIDWRGRARQG